MQQKVSITKSCSKIVLTYFAENNITLYPFPVMSPNLNHIKHYWNLLKANIFPEGCTSWNEFVDQVKRAWHDIPHEIIQINKISTIQLTPCQEDSKQQLCRMVMQLNIEMIYQYKQMYEINYQEQIFAYFPVLMVTTVNLPYNNNLTRRLKTGVNEKCSEIVEFQLMLIFITVQSSTGRQCNSSSIQQCVFHQYEGIRRRWLLLILRLKFFIFKYWLKLQPSNY
ncbi:DDE_superfamily endonuclease domain-containing protein [Hexamita inflata]|uniref:DDE superfamily endonuclease domain-containing protein n=1 Tax=Hexamita inflata TaxID=28002 RepID=A0AA86UUI8_9EUKA|nr:DDE superfamily endonuclease domain-containing protein [Hexamita inflata]